MKRILPLAITLLLMFVSCSQAPVEYVSQVDTLYIRDTVHTSDRLTGTLHGKVVLYNSHGLATDNSGIAVTMDGTPYSTTTNSDGIWMIDNLPTGTYDVTYARDGYTPYKIFGYQFIGGVADSYITLPSIASSRSVYPALLGLLPAVPNSEITVEKSMVYPDVWSIRGRTAPPTSIVGIRVLFGRDSNVTPDTSTYDMAISLQSGDGSWEIKSTELLNAEFQHGEEIFVACYPTYGEFPLSYQGVTWYWDPAVNGTVKLDPIGSTRPDIVRFVLP